MQNITEISEDLFYLGGNDRRIALFESAFPVPRGVSYNSYLLKDEKTVLFDTVDLAVSELFFENLAYALGGRTLDYVVIHHMEPDHSASFSRLIERYPEAKIVVNAKTAKMLENYFGFTGERIFLVKEGDALSVGKHTVSFLFAPMVHWPEVMMSYIPEKKLLFSADAFGTFGALGGSIFADGVDFDREFLDDARRYYFNIVGKYGVQVQNVLKKAAALEIGMICPLHGPIWRKDLKYLLAKYDTWSRYEPETQGTVVFYASVYGHTQNAAEIVARRLGEKGVPVKIYDVSVTHVSELLSEAFRYSHLVLCSTTYNNGIFVSMDDFLHDLTAHNFQKRKYALVENGSWSPQAGGHMQAAISAWSGMEEVAEKVTLLSSVNEATREKLLALADAIALDFEQN